MTNDQRKLTRAKAFLRLQLSRLRACSLAAFVLSLSAGWAIPDQAHAEITFEDIYANPDDTALSLAYARQQADRGELLDAASSVERLLFSNPNWDDARLLYGTILYRLDDLQAARREFELLDGRPLDPNDRAEVDRYLAALNGRGEALDTVQGVGLRGRIGLSARYDDNAGSVFGDIVFGNRDRPDESLGLLAVLDYSAALGSNASAAGFVRGEYQTRRHEDISDADYDIYGLRAGFRGQAGQTRWEVSGGGTFVDISSEDYLDEYGVRGELSRPLSARWSGGLHSIWVQQDYKELPTNPGAGDRTGDRWELGASLRWQPVAEIDLEAGLAWQDKSARDDALAYTAWKIDGQARIALTSDAYLSGRAVYRDLDFDGENVFLFPAASRQDEYLRLRAAAGVTLGALTRSRNKTLRSTTLELGVNHSRRETNIPSRGFKNTGVEMRVLYDF